MQRRWIRLALVTCCLPAHAAAQAQPRSYQAPYLVSAPSIDGRLDEAAWRGVPWSDAFVDIEGSAKPAPTWRTRMKLAWDAGHLYIAADLEEPDL